MAQANRERYTRDEYRAVYLRSDHWRETRAAALERAGRRCQVCNKSGGLDVHHRTYERLGHEGPGDLTVLCRGCHVAFHGGEASPRPPQRAHKRKKGKRRHRKGDLARDLAAMKRRNEVRSQLTFGPMTVVPVGETDRGFILSVSTDDYEIRVFSAKHGRSLRVWAVPGTEMVETGKPRPIEPWAWHEEQLAALDAELDRVVGDA